ncbi:MAG: hypothetical protein R3A10_06200 [Caldilineaceae bacterium]
MMQTTARNHNEPRTERTPAPAAGLPVRTDPRYRPGLGRSGRPGQEPVEPDFHRRHQRRQRRDGQHIRSTVRRRIKPASALCSYRT